MKCNPWRWLWGLIPVLALGWMTLLMERSRIEADLLARTRDALGKAGYAWAEVAMNGRDAVLTGRAADDSEPAAALKIVNDIWGTRVVENASGLIDKVEKYEWAAVRRDNKIRLDGMVPSDKVRRDLVGMVKGTFPGFDVDDRMKLARGVPTLDTWLGGVAFGLKQLASLKQGRIDISQTQFAINGDAPDVAAYRSVMSAVSSAMPRGITLAPSDVRPPVAKPYTWSVRHKGEQLALAGYVPSDAAADGLRAKAGGVAPKLKLAAQMDPASGAPEGFAVAATALIEAVADLDESAAELKDTAIVVSGLAETAAQADAKRKSLKQAIPATFRVTDQIKVKEPVIKPVAPYVTSAAMDGTTVELAGYVPSEDARQSILAAARQRFSGKTVRDRMELGAGQPQGWQPCLEGGFVALQKLGNGRANLSDATIEVQGTTDAAALADALPGELRTQVGSACEATVRVSVNQARAPDPKPAPAPATEPTPPPQPVDVEAQRKAEAEARARADAEARARADAEAKARAEAEARSKAQADEAARTAVAAACQAALRSVAKSGVIQFQRASTVLDSASFPTLAKLAMAAQRCPDVKIEIEGHTDTDGTPDRNQRLSERRAQSVVDYMIKAGVPIDRLHAVGYGETRNVAPNDTPDNKAKNRRIEFTVK